LRAQHSGLRHGERNPGSLADLRHRRQALAALSARAGATAGAAGKVGYRDWRLTDGRVVLRAVFLRRMTRFSVCDWSPMAGLLYLTTICVAENWFDRRPPIQHARS